MLTLIGFIISIMLLLFGMEIWQQNNSQLSSSAFVYQAILNNEDNSARSVHGVVALNKAEFEKSVKRANIPTWNKAKINPDKDIFFKYDYDTSNNALDYINNLPNHSKVSKTNYNPAKEAIVPIKKVMVYVRNPNKRTTYTLKDGKGKTITKQGYELLDSISDDVSSVVKLRKDDATV